MAIAAVRRRRGCALGHDDLRRARRHRDGSDEETGVAATYEYLGHDLFVQAPYHSQSLNRYSYVWNNPLTLVDPRAGSRLARTARTTGHLCGDICLFYFTCEASTSTTNCDESVTEISVMMSPGRWSR
jgi:hypothetical protein